MSMYVAENNNIQSVSDMKKALDVNGRMACCQIAAVDVNTSQTAVFQPQA